MGTIVLQGITWGHSRGYTPLVAYSQRFSERYPGVEITWKKRTLQEFADFPIEELTRQYDLLIVDHPWVGCAASLKCVLPLDEYISQDYLEEQARSSVGGSHQSYFYEGHQWALAIDAATPVASYRPDLLQQHQALLPENWKELIELARQGVVAAPGIPIDLLMNFYMFCLAHGKEPFTIAGEVIDTATGLLALEAMKELYSVLDKKMFLCNPISVAELMTRTDDYWYCPFAYGYSNYSRTGYAEHLLHYTDLIRFDGNRLRSTIGGTGIAVSSHSSHSGWAVKFAEEITAPQCQSTFYVQHGGQPGHKTAWLDKEANTLCHDFFRNVLPAMENGYVRPRYNGYLYFQDHAGEPLQQYLQYGGNPLQVLRKMNHLYHQSLQPSLVNL